MAAGMSRWNLHTAIAAAHLMVAAVVELSKALIAGGHPGDDFYSTFIISICPHLHSNVR
jgi:hypothetical protein